MDRQRAGWTACGQPWTFPHAGVARHYSLTVRRWLRRIGFGTAIALLLAIASLGVFALTLPEDDVSVIESGLLVVTDDVAGEWRTGDLTVTLDTDQLTVTEGDRVVWQSPAGEAFLTAARGSFEMEEHRGYFWPQVHHERSWTEQRVDAGRPVRRRDPAGRHPQRRGSRPDAGTRRSPRARAAARCWTSRSGGPTR